MFIPGLSNTVGRILAGFVSDFPWCDCLLVHNVALVIGGTATAFVPLIHTFPLLVAYCILFGFAIGMSGCLFCIFTCTLMFYLINVHCNCVQCNFVLQVPELHYVICPNLYIQKGHWFYKRIFVSHAFHVKFAFLWTK